MAKGFQKITSFTFLVSSLLVPFLALALVEFPDRIAGGGDIPWIEFLQGLVHNIFSFIWILFYSFAFGMFIYAGFLFLNAKGDPSEIKRARQALLWAVIGVMVGLLAFKIPFIVSNLLGF